MNNKFVKKIVFGYIILILIILMVVASLVIFIDPYFHFHKPIDGLAYPLTSAMERYQNDGILRHFEYDSIIIGSSMTENFKTSQFDALFFTNSVKVPYFSGSYKEINDSLNRAVLYNKNIKVVFRCIDYMYLLDDAEYVRYDLPYYLYDDNIFNDVKYIFNKEVLLGAVSQVIQNTCNGKSRTSFDEYASWDYKSIVDSSSGFIYKRNKPQQQQFISDDECQRVYENVSQNIIQFAEQNPNIDIYIFIPPYSAVFWDDCIQQGIFEKYLKAEECAISLILKCDNIHLFSFNLRTDITCDLSYYRDELHYDSSINSFILDSVYEGCCEITKDNYKQYINDERRIYYGINYEKLFDEQGLVWEYK